MSWISAFRKRIRGTGGPGFPGGKTASLLLILLFSTACNILGPDDPDFGEPEAGEVKVLFIGSSYVDTNDMDGIFGEMSEAAGKQLFLARRVQPGYYLDFFAQDGITARAIRDQKWDFVVLSGGCQTAAYPDTHHLIMSGSGHHDPYPALETLKQKVTENHQGTVLIYMMPWAFEDGMTWIQGQSDDFFAMQEKIRTNALAWANTLDLRVAPVGMAWAEVMGWNIPQHYLHIEDWNHPSPRGSFLAAATIFSTVFKESSEEVDFRWLLGSTEAEAFRRVASETVLDSLALWNIKP